MYGPFWRLALGGLFLLIGLYIARPYCRYLCPYGALLSMLSRWTSIGVRTTPKECINCTLCDASCPFEAIQRPVPSTKASPPIRKFLAPGALVVLLAFTAGGYFATGGTISGSLLGAWFGVVIGTSLLSLAREGKRETYEVDQAACLSCGRCYESCPHEREKWGIEGQHEPIG
jgi:polyferredoxin